ncbi:MAG: twin-arginine translocation pathway signal protein [Pseudomonadota bacterium]
MATRRAFLIAGGAAVLVTGGYGFSVATRSLNPARAPWRAAGESFGDPRLDALAYAVLAPNPHNKQPWRVRLEGEDAFTIFADPDRLLPETDPPNRQIVIGFGCFLETFRIAAAEAGWRAEITPFPEGEPQPTLDNRPIARARLIADDGVARDTLFAHILTRRTNREKYDEAAPSSEAFAAVEAAVGDHAQFGRTVEASDVAWWRNLALDAWDVEFSTPRIWKESVDVTRIGAKAINENPDGIAISGPVMEVLSDTRMITVEKMMTPGTSAHEQSRAFYAEAIKASPAFGWLTTGDNTRGTQLRTGAAWVRLQLAATGAGLATHPLSQALQEFPEMADLYAAAHDRLGVVAPGVVQGLFRFGYASAPAPAPRWPLEAALIPA